MARSESEAESKSDETMSQFKEKLCGFNKKKILKLLFSLMDECEAISTENCMLKDTCSNLKGGIRMLEKAIKNLRKQMRFSPLKRMKKLLP